MMQYRQETIKKNTGQVQDKVQMMRSCAEHESRQDRIKARRWRKMSCRCVGSYWDGSLVETAYVFFLVGPEFFLFPKFELLQYLVKEEVNWKVSC